MDYDHILNHHLNDNGPFFVFHLLLLWAPPLVSGMVVLQASFSGIILAKDFDSRGFICQKRTQANIIWACFLLAVHMLANV
jgi:hypothetical protein